MTACGSPTLASAFAEDDRRPLKAATSGRDLTPEEVEPGRAQDEESHCSETRPVARPAADATGNLFGFAVEGVRPSRCSSSTISSSRDSRDVASLVADSHPTGGSVVARTAALLGDDALMLV